MTNLRRLFKPKGTVIICKENYNKSIKPDLIPKTLSGNYESGVISQYKIEDLTSAYLIHFKYADDAIEVGRWAVEQGFITVRART